MKPLLYIISVLVGLNLAGCDLLEGQTVVYGERVPPDVRYD